MAQNIFALESRHRVHLMVGQTVWSSSPISLQCQVVFHRFLSIYWIFLYLLVMLVIHRIHIMATSPHCVNIIHSLLSNGAICKMQDAYSSHFRGLATTLPAPLYPVLVLLATTIPQHPHQVVFIQLVISLRQVILAQPQILIPGLQSDWFRMLTNYI